MARTREQIAAERRRLRAEYRELYDEVAAVLLRHDPIGINLGTNTDEYEPEVGTILPRLRSCRSVDDVHRVVYEECVAWFSVEGAGPRDRYAQIAAETWRLWQKFSAT